MSRTAAIQGCPVSTRSSSDFSALRTPGCMGDRRRWRELRNREGRGNMAQKKVWLVTGAGRGMGVDIARAALAAGHAVVATGRDPERVSSVIGAHNDLLVVRLDVTSLDD